MKRKWNNNAHKGPDIQQSLNNTLSKWPQVWVVVSFFFIMYSESPIVFKLCTTNKHSYLKFPGSCGLSLGDLKPSPGLGMWLKAFFQPCQGWAQLNRDLDPRSSAVVHALRDPGSFIYREHCVPGPDCPLTPAAAVWTELTRGGCLWLIPMFRWVTTSFGTEFFL